MEKLTEEEIREKVKKYRWDPEIEKDITKTLNERNFLTKSEVEKAIHWKMSNQVGRANLNIEKLQIVPDETVELVTKAALQLTEKREENEEEIIKTQVKILSSLPGVGNATATAILTFNDPKNYAVGDRYVLARIFGEEKAITATNYPKLLKKLKEVNPSNFPLRKVEKAYWSDYNESTNQI